MSEFQNPILRNGSLSYTFLDIILKVKKKKLKLLTDSRSSEMTAHPTRND